MSAATRPWDARESVASGTAVAGPLARRSKHAHGSALDAAARDVWPAVGVVLADVADALMPHASERERLDFARAARQIIERLLQTITEQLPPGIDPFYASRAVGEECARREVALPHLCAAAQACAERLWVELVRARGAGPRATSHKLAMEAGRYWRCVSDHMEALRYGYRRRLADPSELAATAMPELDLRDLFLDTVRITAPAGSVIAVAILGEHAAGDAHRIEERLRDAGFPSVWQDAGDTVLGVVAAEAAAADEVAAAVGEHAHGRVGLAPPMRFGKVRDALSIATWTARSLPASHPAVARAEDRLPAVLVAAAPEVAPLLVNRSVGALLALPSADGRDLLRTVMALVDADGSPSEASKRLFCHRNTVMYRLRRIRLLSGRGVDTTQDKVAWTLGILALAIHNEHGARLVEGCTAQQAG